MRIFKKHWIIYTSFLFIVAAMLSYWAFNKFYPAQTGEWSRNDAENFDESYIPNSDWTNNSFWVSLDFPGKQNVCLDIYAEDNNPTNSQMEIPVTQAPRAYFYPEAGTLADFFSQMTPAQVEEKIKQGKPYFIGHLADNIAREGKDIFFVGENEKFLVPTKAIFSKHFPMKELPAPVDDPSALPFANVLVNLPEGILLSDGQGVFVVSQGKLFLIRSPEVFEAMGYKWEEVKQMDNYEKSFNSYLSGNLIDFDSANPNGTILKDAKGLFLVWGEKLYSLTPEEQAEYFPEQPIVEIDKKDLRADCSSDGNSKRISCCIDNADTRLNPPSYSPFLNTIEWDMSKFVKKDSVEKIDWQSKIAVNKESTLRRLGSLKNFILYGLGIVK